MYFINDYDIANSYQLTLGEKNSSSRISEGDTFYTQGVILHNASQFKSYAVLFQIFALQGPWIRE